MNSETGPMAMGFALGLFVSAVLFFVSAVLFLGWREYDARKRCEATQCAVGAPILGDGLRCLCATEATND